MHFTRRDFLKVSGAGAAALSLGGCIEGLGTESKATKKPNILWLSIEDISPHFGCYGDENAITPNIDQVAKEGIRYTRAFTVHGVCAPCRSGIISGMYPSSLGSVNMRCTAEKPADIKCFTEYMRDAGYYCCNNSKEDYNFPAPKEAWDESSRNAHWKKVPEGKPFFSVFNYGSTHESGIWDSKNFDKTHPKQLKESEWQDPAKMNVPPIYPDTLAVRRDLARLNEKITTLDYFVKGKLDELKEAGLYEDTIVFIWSDHGDGLPRAKRWLYDSGTLVPVLVRIPKKFRVDGQGKAGTVDDQFVNSIDFGTTVLNLAGVTVPEHMQGRAFLGKELSAEREYIFGARGRIDEMYDMVRAVRDTRYRYIRNFNTFLPYLPYLDYAERCNTMKEMRRLYAEGKLNDVQAQWMANRRPAEELYDLEKDPWETKNLANDAKYAAVKARLDNVLSDWMIETRDTGLLPEPMMKRLIGKFGSEYAILHRKGGEKRCRRLLRTAKISAAPKESDRKRINKALKGKDAAMRYWAVVSLGQLTPKNDVDKLRAATTDKEASVRIAAARSLYWAGRKSEAVNLLLKELDDINVQEENLHFALDVLQNCGDDARGVLAKAKQLKEIKKRSPKITAYVKRVAEVLTERFE